MSNPVFDVRGVTFRYNRVTALDELSLAIAPGERVVLLGANGSGKSTLLRLLDGLAFPEAGTIAFRGEALTEKRLAEPEFSQAFRRRVGLVFQNPAVQLFSPTVLDEVAFGPLQLGWPKAKVRAAAAAALEFMGIARLEDRSPHQLSTGEMKRVALASVLVLDPEVLLLDEPTAALDPKSASAMIDFLASLAGGSRTVVTATHHLDIVEEIGDRCLVFGEGRVVSSGSPRETLEQVPLLEQAGLIHAHRHAHTPSEVHSHHHLHPRQR